MKIFTENVALVAHIVLDPNEFRTSKKRSRVSRREQERYWGESLAQAGVDDLPAFYTYEWCAPVANIHQEVVLHHLRESVYMPSVSKDEWSAKEILKNDSIGGLSLMHNGKVIAPSMCCADLTNIDEWRQAVAHRKTDWVKVWNGHPWLYARYQDDHIVFTDPTEKDAPSLTAGRFAIPLPVFQQAVTKASQDIDLFLERFDVYMRSTTI